MEIYAIKNTITGRLYIGASADARRRYLDHVSLLRRHKHKIELLQEDFDRCGVDAFKLYVIAQKGDHFDERYWQAFFRTNDPEYGYNYKDIHNRAKAIEDFPEIENPLKDHWGY